jgi:hypothetical protein
MLVGHVAAAFVAKGLHPRLSLGTTVAAALLADVLLFSFVLADIEHVQFRTSAAAGLHFTGTDIAFSHGLAMSLFWSAALAAIYVWRRGDRRAAALLAAVVISHWVLDVLSHRPAGSAVHGLVPMMIIEGTIWACAVALYVSDSRSVNSAGRYVFWGGVAALTYVWHDNAFGLPRGNPPQDAPIEGLLLLLLAVAWAYWMNRAREMKQRGR